MKRPILRLASSIAVLIFATSSGCGSEPCAELTARVCASTDDKACKLYGDSVGGRSPSASQQKACGQLLDDEQTLSGVLDLLKKRAGR